MWQDILLAISLWVLLAALVPTILHKTQKPTLSTSATTTLALAAITAAYLSLAFWWSALPSFLLAASWATITYQRYRLNKGRSGRS